MAHLLIDTVKTDTGRRYLPLGKHRVLLFADKRSAKPFRLLFPQQNADSGTDAWPQLRQMRKKDIRKVMLTEACRILCGEPQAAVALIGRGGRLRRKLGRLQQQYPDARIFYGRKTGKKLRRFLAEEGRPSENAIRTDTSAVFETASAPSAFRQSPPERPAAESADTPPAAVRSELQHALQIIRKNRPRKKTALLALLQQQHEGESGRLLAELIELGHLKIDAAENVRYL